MVQAHTCSRRSSRVCQKAFRVLRRSHQRLGLLGTALLIFFCRPCWLRFDCWIVPQRRLGSQRSAAVAKNPLEPYLVFAHSTQLVSEARWRTAGVLPGAAACLPCTIGNVRPLKKPPRTASLAAAVLPSASTALGSQTIGYLCCIIACFGFGSNYIPVKKVDVKDGAFFTLCLSVGVLTVGVVQWLLAGQYPFEPFAMLGGAIWATGNALVPFIIQNCGLGLGQLAWSVTNMSTGWACGTFGLLGKTRDAVANPGLNYAGVAVTALSLSLFSLLKNETESPQEGKPRRRFALGFGAALFAGLFMGSNFNPSTYLQQQGEADRAAGLQQVLWRHSPDATAYVLSHFIGIFLASGLLFFFRNLVSANSCYWGRELVIPGLISGILWGLAQVCWFRANGSLSYVVAFPIIVGVPGLIAAFWGVLLFGENRGRRNLLVLALIIFIQACGVTLIALSKGLAS